MFTHRLCLAVLILFSLSINAQDQVVLDDFEGNGIVKSWFGDNCNINTGHTNPYPEGINTSATVMEYSDVGGQYANVQFDMDGYFDIKGLNVFSLKVYIPSSGLTGNQNSQVSLKLQNGNLDEPWTTQCEIIKSVGLDKWQTVSFDFINDRFINLSQNSPAPVLRKDFNRLVIQLNGENNTDHVLAFIDDVVNYSVSNEVNPDTLYSTLVWSDEFDGAGSLDASKWHHQTKLPNGNSWHNGEIQHYTNRDENSYVKDGILYLTARKEKFTDQGVTKQYTSARLNSKFAFTYGKIEVRAKLPKGTGTWPAIWTLGKNISETGAYWQTQGFGNTSWPACGEIDIMEHWGDHHGYVQSAMHTPSSYGGTNNKGGQMLEHVSDAFYVYSLDWYPDKMVFKVDGITHYTYKPHVYDMRTWPFNSDQYLLLNFAVLPHIDQSFTEDAMEVDYVRIYQQEEGTSNALLKDQNNFDLLNFPNPAEKQTTIRYHLEKASKVNIQVYDAQGRMIKTLLNQHQSAGRQYFDYDLSTLAPGLYYYTLRTEDQSLTKACLVL